MNNNRGKAIRPFDPILLAICVSSAAIHIGTRAVAGGPPASLRDMVCGPRCVQCVLGWYGKSEELAPIIGETQLPDVRQGSSLRSLQESLEQRGIHSAAVQVPPRNRIEWRYPIILHDANAPAEREPIGHFFVWVPGNGDHDAFIFTAGSPNTGQALIDDFFRHGGVALATSPSSDAPFRDAFSPLETERHLLIGSLFVSIGALAAVLRLPGTRIGLWRHARRAPVS